MVAHHSFFLFITHASLQLAAQHSIQSAAVNAHLLTHCNVLFVRCLSATAVSDQILLPIAYGVLQCATRLAKLQQLQLSSCAALTLSAVRGFPALTSLDLSHCEALLSAAAVSLMHVLTWLHHVPHLKRGCKACMPVITSLDLSCCELLLLAKFHSRNCSVRFM